MYNPGVKALGIMHTGQVGMEGWCTHLIGRPRELCKHRIGRPRDTENTGKVGLGNSANTG
jgi:hypothetical protein